LPPSFFSRLNVSRVELLVGTGGFAVLIPSDPSTRLESDTFIGRTSPFAFGPSERKKMKVTMMLADHAQVADGKLFISGGGWNVTGPGPVPFAIALYIEVPWDRTNTKHTFKLELLDADGEPVTVETPEGTQPILGEGEFEVGRPTGMKPGTPVAIPLAFGFQSPPPLPPGGRYVWQLHIDGETDEDWRLTFSTRPNGPQSLAA
jgi:hypothetical protein